MKNIITILLFMLLTANVSYSADETKAFGQKTNRQVTIIYAEKLKTCTPYRRVIELGWGQMHVDEILGRQNDACLFNTYRMLRGKVVEPALMCALPFSIMNPMSESTLYAIKTNTIVESPANKYFYDQKYCKHYTKKDGMWTPIKY